MHRGRTGPRRVPPWTCSSDQARSKRSRFITLFQAATKSCHEPLLGVLGSVDLRDRPELRVRPEDKIHTGAGPLEIAGRAITPLEHVIAESEAASHFVPMSSRFTKKSLVSSPRPLGEHPMPGPVRHSRPGRACRRRAPSSRAPSAPAAGPGRPAAVLRRYGVLAVEVVAEPSAGRFQHGEGLDVGLLLRRVRPSRRERNLHVVPGILRGLLDGRAPAEDDDVGQRDTLAVGLRVR